MPSTARRGPWSTAEDKFLLQIVQQQGANNWVRISQMLRTRTPKQCRERFHQNLKPTLNHNPITPEEGLLIEHLVGEMGKKWAEIARRLHGRSDNAVKNWWNGGQNRRRRMSERRRSEHHHPSSAPSMSSHFNTPFQHPHHHHINEHYHSYHQHRPSPISIHGHAFGSRSYDTPIPSPSGQSILSADGAPSLVTDSGSVESRSPIERSLPPLLGSREERRRSSVAFLPRDSSFAITDDDQLPSFRRSDSADENRKRDVLRLPEPHSTFSHSPPGTQAQPLFREPNYQQMGHRSLPLLTQGFPASKPLPVEPPPTASTSPGPYPPQHQLPGFHSLTQPGRLPSMALTGHPSPPRGSTASSFSVEKTRSPGMSKPNNVASILN